MAVTAEQLVGVLIRDREALFAYCWSILRDDDLAEETLQEVSALAVEKRQMIVNEKHLAGWLRLAARHKAYEAIRARHGRPLLLDDELLDMLESQWARYDAVPAASLMDSLRQCMAGLGDGARNLIDLRYGKGIKSAEIARRLKRNVQAVYVALTRIHTKLADCIRARLPLSQ